VRCHFIAAEKAHYPVQRLCRALGVTRSGFYAWARRPPAPRTRDDARLLVRVRVAHAESRGTYGRPRLTRALRHAGIRISGKRVARLMRAAGLVARGRRRFRVTTQAAADRYCVPNRLARRFAPRDAGGMWAADITACWTRAGWCYLAVILDLATRRVVGWAVRPDLTTELVRAALHRALGRHGGRPVLHHSDRGTQYASAAYHQLLAVHGITASMSRTGNCWDNAPVESFFSTLKTELWPDRPWVDPQQATAAIGDYIDRFYNTHRLHSSLGYRTPAAVEAAREQRL
jgi:transposase InsO family protein